MYKVDVTEFRDIESEDGFPKSEEDEIKAHELFQQTIADVYSNPNFAGAYTVTLYVGEHPLFNHLVNVPRR